MCEFLLQGMRGKTSVIKRKAPCTPPSPLGERTASTAAWRDPGPPRPPPTSPAAPLNLPPPPPHPSPAATRPAQQGPWKGEALKMYEALIDDCGTADEVLIRLLNKTKLNYSERFQCLCRYLLEGGVPWKIAEFWSKSGQLGNAGNIKGTIHTLERLRDTHEGRIFLKKTARNGRMEVCDKVITEEVSLPFPDSPAKHKEYTDAIKILEKMAGSHKASGAAVPIDPKRWLEERPLNEDEPFAGDFTYDDV